MKPSAHTDPERWRHEDVNLRRALQQRYAHVPTLPEGFAERMQQRMAPRQRRRLWPFYAASAAVAALLALVLLISKTPYVSPAGDELAVRPLPSAGEPPAPALVLQAEAPSSTHPKAASPKHPEAVAHDAPTDTGVIPAEPVEVAIGEPVADPTENLAEEADTPSPVSTRRREWTTTTSSPHRDRQPLTLVLDVSPTALGTDLAMNDADAAYRVAVSGSINSEENAMADAPRAHDDAYYRLIGDGYVYDFQAAETRQGAPQRSQTPTRSQAVSHTDHRFPVSLALRLEVPLNKTFALETGLGYTRLRSTFDLGSTQSYTHTQQTLHYLGLPLYLKAAIVKRTKWQLYGSAGISVEFPVAATADILHYRINTPTSHAESHLSPAVQVAPSVGLGVQYQLSTHIGVYVQPSLQWFPATDDHVSSYRTEHPLNLTVPFGLRWTF